jgi:D-alanyl-lipoteichoic acid acyltransferase DltB (MBOAT superfamily)
MNFTSLNYLSIRYYIIFSSLFFLSLMLRDFFLILLSLSVSFVYLLHLILFSTYYNPPSPHHYNVSGVYIYLYFRRFLCSTQTTHTICIRYMKHHMYLL